MELIGDIFILLLLEPMINGLVLLYTLLFHQMGLAIIALTVMVRLAFYPLTLRQFRSARKMQEIQPKIEELRRRYKETPQVLQRETMRLYREGGVNPLGCLGPMVIQFPIWIGLYWAIIRGMGDLPGNLIYMSQHLYSWLPQFAELLPLEPGFLWLNLTLPDTTPILPVLVAASTWLQQKIMQPPTMSPQQRQQQTTMLFLFPLREGAGGRSGAKIVFYFLAGLYFGAVYTVRGFGVVVATHAFYDIFVVSLLGDGG